MTSRDAADRVLLGLPLRLHRGRALALLGELALDRLAALGGGVVGLLGERGQLDLELHHAAVDLVDLGRQRVDLDAQPRGGLVDQVDRLVGQEAVGDVAVRELGGGDQRGVLDADAVVVLVALLEAAQDRDRVLDGGLVDQHRLEAALERGVLLDVLAVLVERGRADRAQLAAREHRLEQVGGVDGALGGAGADDRVQLVDEEDDGAAASAISLSTAFRRSSNSPRYFAPASSAPRSSATTRRSRSDSGTSPETIRWARPSTIAVLPTPGSPISTGLFLVRRERIWMTRRISASRPITGSSLPSSALGEVAADSARAPGTGSSGFWSVTRWEPRTSSRRRSRRSRVAPAARSASPARPGGARARAAGARSRRSRRRARGLAVGGAQQARQLARGLAAFGRGVLAKAGQLPERALDLGAQGGERDAELGQGRQHDATDPAECPVGRRRWAPGSSSGSRVGFEQDGKQMRRGDLWVASLLGEPRGRGESFLRFDREPVRLHKNLSGSVADFAGCSRKRTGYANPMQLADLIAPARRVAVVGLAKNTGKTETLGAILRELEERGRTVGVTSVGRDGEARDAIDSRIEKPRVRLCAGSLVATTDALLRASALPYELLDDTGIRTPLGRVLLARLQTGGAIEVAGPSGALDVRAVADAMLAAGAQQVLIDGAIDRRAASSPEVCDGLVMCTGAVLHEEIERVVELTRDAVELVRLPLLQDERVRALAAASRGSLLVGGEGAEPVALPPSLVLTGTDRELAQLLAGAPSASHLIVHGALCEPFLGALLSAAAGRRLEIVVADSTKVFPGDRGWGWYRRHGLCLRVLASICLSAVTVNPVAPRSHSFETGKLCALLKTGSRTSSCSMCASLVVACRS